MKYVVTGGAGFLGSHLVHRLLADDHDVWVVDDVSSGFEQNLPDSPRLNTTIMDVRDLGDRRQVGFDGLFHLASYASPRRYVEEPIKTAMTSAAGTDSVLRWAAVSDCPVLFTSTSEVYGDPLEHPQSETYNGNVALHGPRSVYDEGKRFAESLCLAYVKEHGLSIGIARVFNCYGPKMDPYDGRVVPTFLRQAAAGEPLTVQGEGGQTRSFCYVTDMVEGLVRLMELTAYLGGLVGPMNLGSDHEVTMAELADIVLEVTGSESPIERTPRPQDDPTQRRPDLTVAHRLIDWRPTVPLAEGLRSTAASLGML